MLSSMATMLTCSVSKPYGDAAKYFMEQCDKLATQARAELERAGVPLSE